MSFKAASVSLIMIISLAGGVLAGTYSGGSGEPNNPYRISTPNDLNDIGNHVEDFNKCFVMVNDINLADYNGTQFNIIGTGDFVDGPIWPIFVATPFTGTFDGNGFEISSFNYSCTGTDTTYCIGLFGVVGSPNAEIKDLRLTDTNINVEPGDRIGSLVGFFLSGTMTGCYAERGSLSGDYRVGGLVGHSGEGVLISNCYANTDISGHSELGGLVGSTYYGIISNCCCAGNVTATGYFVGGLVGGNYYGTISNCYCTGNVHGRTDIGGLVGENRGPISNCYATGSVSNFGVHVGGLVGLNSNATISKCYSIGSVTGNEYLGGLVGTNFGGMALDSFWDTETSAQAASDGGEGKTTLQMQTERTFIDAGWDFVEVWDIGENQTYPFLRKYLAGDLNHDGIADWRDFAILASRWLEGF